MALALDDPPLDAVRLRDGEQRVPVDGRRATLAVGIATGLTEDRVEGLHILAHAVLLRMQRRGTVRILLVLGHRIDARDEVARAGRPADVLFHADVVVGMREEVVPERRAVLHADRMLPRVVVEADLAAHLLRDHGRLVIELDELLRELVDLLRGLAGLAAATGGPGGARGNVAAAGADDERVAVARLECAGLLEDVRIERALLHVEAVLVVRHVRAAHLEAVVRAGVQVVRLPKTDSAQDVIDCEREIERIEKEAGIPVGTTGMMAAIESANGVLNAASIAKASDRLIGIALGAEDYVTDLKTTRSDGIELLFARSMILNAARAAGIAALDTVYSDVNNEEGFVAEATIIKKLGFDGKSIINPRQIEPLHKVFMPSEKDLNKARAIMDAIAEANARGSGVASLKGKMIDKPVVIRAQRLLDLYEAGRRIDEVED